jgi:hypothetical protein
MLLKLRYDEPLSNFAFNFNLRHYIEGISFGTRLIFEAMAANGGVEPIETSL